MCSSADICETIAKYALQSLLYEVSATPKPGLVDRCNQGAHQDMDFFTFMSSSAALPFYFFRCALKGLEYAAGNPVELFKELRPLGMEAEKNMLKATGGVNTHKGLLFSLGILCAVASCCSAEQKISRPGVDSICRKVAALTEGISHRELEVSDKTTRLTHGEILYRKYGLKGIRGEAENGFPTVRNYALPVFRNLKTLHQYNFNDILVQVLLHLMTVTEDTNVVARHDQDTLNYVKQYSSKALNVGGMFSPVGRSIVYQMDNEFIKRNISPGGAADLLAVTIMFDLICNDA